MGQESIVSRYVTFPIVNVHEEQSPPLQSRIHCGFKEAHIL